MIKAVNYSLSSIVALFHRFPRGLFLLFRLRCFIVSILLPLTHGLCIWRERVLLCAVFSKRVLGQVVWWCWSGLPSLPCFSVSLSCNRKECGKPLIIGLSVSPFSYVSFRFMYFKTLLLGPQSFRTVTLQCVSWLLNVMNIHLYPCSSLLFWS